MELENLLTDFVKDKNVSNIIIDMKHQIEHSEKFNNVLEEMKKVGMVFEGIRTINELLEIRGFGLKKNNIIKHQLYLYKDGLLYYKIRFRTTIHNNINTKLYLMCLFNGIIDGILQLRINENRELTNEEIEILDNLLESGRRIPEDTYFKELEEYLTL